MSYLRMFLNTSTENELIKLINENIHCNFTNIINFNAQPDIYYKLVITWYIFFFNTIGNVLNRVLKLLLCNYGVYILIYKWKNPEILSKSSLASSKNKHKWLTSVLMKKSVSIVLWWDYLFSANFFFIEL